jgi:hypothetical protein
MKNLQFFIKDNKITLLKTYSHYGTASKKAKMYLGKDAKLLVSTRADKKYMILDPTTNKYVHFGQMGYEDYTKTGDDSKRFRYLRRATNIKGPSRCLIKNCKFFIKDLHAA